jgi:selenocysteine-specific elongation factor
VIQGSNLQRETAHEAVEELLSEGRIITMQGEPSDVRSLVTSLEYWNDMKTRVDREILQYHRTNPLRRGMPREELKSRLKMGSRAFSALTARLLEQNRLDESGPVVYKPGHEIQFSEQQQRAIDVLLARFTASPHSPPTIKECVTAVGEDVYAALIDLDKLLPLSSDVVFRHHDYNDVVDKVRRLIGDQGGITVAQARDYFKTSRRYVLALLEYMDAQGVTVRDGDVRRLKGK